MAFTYTKIADYILDQFWGFGSANTLKNSLRNVAEDILGLPGTRADAANTIIAAYTRSTGISVTTPNMALSTSSGSFSSSSGAMVDITNLSVTLVSTGRPVLVGLSPDGGTSSAILEVSGNSSTHTQADASYRFLIDGATTIGRCVIDTIAANAGTVPGIQIAVPASSFFTFCFPSAASHTYKMQGQLQAGVTFYVYNSVLFAVEL